MRWSAEVTKKVVKNVMFCAPILGETPFGGGAFVNRHHFRPTGQVWLRCHGWSFIYADEKKEKEITAIKHNGLAFCGHKKRQGTG